MTQYRIDHLSRKSKEWRRRKCPIYDPGTGSNITEESFLIPKDELYLRKVSSENMICDIIWVCHFYRSPIHEPIFPSYGSPPAFIILLSNHSSLDVIIDTLNSTVQRCKQEIDEGIFKPISKIIFVFNGGTATNLLWRAKSIFAPNSYFRSMPRVAIANPSSDGGKIKVYRQEFVGSWILVVTFLNFLSTYAALTFSTPLLMTMLGVLTQSLCSSVLLGQGKI